MRQAPKKPSNIHSPEEWEAELRRIESRYGGVLDKNKPLTVRAIDGELVIRIGVNVLAGAIAGGNAFHQYDDSKGGDYFRNFAITDADRFARDVACELTREEEDGSSPVTKLIDAMGQAAIDEGSVAVEYEQEIKFGEKSPMEKW